jgi:hypothetical protein
MPEINIPQAKFLQLPHKFRAYVGGFGSGKTWAGCFAMCDHYWLHPKVNQGYFAPTFPHIRDIFYPTIEEVAFESNLTVDIKESNKEVHFFRGRKSVGTTICRSMERPNSIIGFRVGHGLIDELDVMPPLKAQLAWRKIIARLRWPGADNGVDVTTTPEGFGETHRLFVQMLTEKPELRRSYGLVQASTRDNELNLPDDYIQSMLDTYPSQLIDAYIDGRFCNLTSGTVYHCYDRHRHSTTETIQEHDTLHIGMDFNVTRMAATIYVTRGDAQDEWHAVAELKEVFDTPAVVKIINERWPNHNKIVYPDASGTGRNTSDASKSDMAIITQAGMALKVNASNPAVKDRVLSTNKRFELGKLFVNVKECPTVARCFEQQSYDVNGEPDKKSGVDHQNDASTYPIAHTFPIIRPMHKVRVGGH